MKSKKVIKPADESYWVRAEPQGEVPKPPPAPINYRAIKKGCLILVVIAICFCGYLNYIFAVGSRSAMNASAVSNFKQVDIALTLYIEENDNNYPLSFSSTDNLSDALMAFTRNEALFSTLNEGGEMLPNSPLAGQNKSQILNPEKTIVLYESKDWPNGKRIVVYADGVIKQIENFSDKMLKVEFKKGTEEQE